MNPAKIFRKRSFSVITMLMLILAIAVNGLGYWGLEWLLKTYTPESAKVFVDQNFFKWFEYLKYLFDHFYIWVVPTISAGFLLIGWSFWIMLSIGVGPALARKEAEPENRPESTGSKKDFLRQKIEQERKQRLFLHTLAILQREGRLLDFFDEDLSLYDDEQIGAAVRSIQEDCKKAIKKYVDPKPVIDMEEGEAFTVEPGFDMDSIALVGNVAGEPPFEGILRHRGWKAGKKEVPKLSDIQDPGVMIPAEIEIP